MSKNKAPSQRQLRVGELIRHKLAQMLARAEVHDPVLETNVITVSEVSISPDLRKATAYIAPLGGQNAKQVLTALNRTRKYIRGQIARELTLKYSPEVHFRLDETFDYSDKIGQLLNSPEVSQDLE